MTRPAEPTSDIRTQPRDDAPIHATHDAVRSFQPREMVLSIRGETRIIRLDTPEAQALYQQRVGELYDEFSTQVRSGILGSDDLLPVLNRGIAGLLSLAKIRYGLKESGDSSRGQEEGLPEACQSLASAKQDQPALLLGVHFDPEKLQQLGLRIQQLTELRDTVDTFREPLDQTLASDQRDATKTVREACRTVTSLLPTNAELRRQLSPATTFVSRAALQGVETTKKMDRLARDVEARTMEKLSRLPATPAPAAAPIGPEAPATMSPLRTTRG